MMPIRNHSGSADLWLRSDPLTWLSGTLSQWNHPESLGFSFGGGESKVLVT